MKNLRWIIFFVFLHTSLYLHAQPYIFKVLVCKGKIEVKSGDAWTSVKTGNHLNLSDEVKIGENSYLGLLHASGKPLELKSADTYSVTTLSSKMGKESSVMNKYADFILSIDDEKKNRLSATGAVHRDLKMPIIVYLPKTGDHYGTTLSVNWKAPNVTEDFEIFVGNMMEEQMGSYGVRNNVHGISVEVSSKWKDSPGLVIVVTAKDGSKSERYIIKKLTGPHKSEVDASLAEVQPLLAEQSALSKYLLASVYEEKLLLSDAITAYKEAADMEPGVEIYREAYVQFLQRLGFQPE